MTYPTSSGSRTELAKISDFIPSGTAVTKYSYSPSTNLTAYTRSDCGTVFGSVFTTDKCTVVGKSGNKLQLIYPLDSGGYKLGWIAEPEDVGPSDFPVPLYAYNASASNRTPVYEHKSTLGGTKYGEIFIDDKCTLNVVNVSEGWVQVTYPTASTPKTGYVYLSEFVPKSSAISTFYKTTVTTQTDTYRKADMATNYGWISAGDEITVVGKNGNKLQVYYPIDAQYGGGYKLAWIYNTNVKKNLVGISITSNPTKTVYFEDESLDTKGLVVTATYDDGSTSNVTASCSITGYDNSEGVKTINVAYGGKKTAFTVTVKKIVPTNLIVKTMPTKTSYYVGEELDLTGINVIANYNNGVSKTVTDYGVGGIEDGCLSSSGTSTIYLYYDYNGIEVSTSFNVVVKEVEPTVTPTVNPTEMPTPNPTETPTATPTLIPTIKPTSTPIVTDANIQVGSVSASAGKTISVPIIVENNPGITAIAFDISYNSEVMELKEVINGELMSGSLFTTSESIIANPYRMIWVSGTKNIENDGTSVTLVFDIKSSAKEGAYDINIAYNPEDIYNTKLENVYFNTENGSVVVTNSIPGDVNRDKKVNTKDVAMILQYAARWEISIDEEAADVNGDTKINSKDAALLLQYCAGWDVELK